MLALSLDSIRLSLQTGVPPLEPITPVLPSEPRREYAIHRFLLAWQRSRRFGPDEAVLLRQVVRWSPESRLLTGAVHESVRALFSRVSLADEPGGYLRAVPLAPQWLDETATCDQPPTPRTRDESFEAECYLPSINYACWRSPAQKEVAWLVLNTPPGGTRVVVLPTGSGKSLCFQLLSRFGSAFTVVIVPTVALAIDQTRSAKHVLSAWPGTNPLYFASDEDPDAVAQALNERKTRLLFASPESVVSGRLRGILDDFAKDGWLANLVIDESHLIETWGAQFRVEFQILAAMRRRWLEASQNRLRTFLFSATMTAECRGLLLEMFSEHGNGAEFVCQRLRPEMAYFHRRFTNGIERDRALMDALWHFPRPAILYVTEVAEARSYARRLHDEQGFQRIGCFHGETRRAERRDLLQRWQSNEIDLMVATSAFGLGVDKADVRAVVHACYPENLDRYYQEVGRCGRDGWSSICLLTPTQRDQEIAQGLTVRLMREEMMQERWDAMFRDAEHVDSYRYRLPVDSRRRGLVGDFTYSENVRWNKRLLLQLNRAGLLDLLDLQFRKSESPDENPEEWAEVQVRFPPNTRKLGELARQEREAERTRFNHGFAQLDEVLAGQRCIARVLAELYGLEAEQRVCGGCPACRRAGRVLCECPPLLFPESATGEYRGAVVADCPNPVDPRESGSFVDLVHQIVTEKRSRCFFAPAARFAQTLPLFKQAFPRNSPECYRVDPLSDQSVIAVPTAEALVFFHFGEISGRAFQLARNRRAIHMLCGVRNAVDADGRSVHVHQDCHFYHNPEAWLQAD